MRTGRERGKRNALARRLPRLFLVLFLAVGVLFPPPTVSADARPEKRDGVQAAGESAALRDQRLGALRDTRERLTVFLSGDKLIDVPAAALFTVDLSSEEAVRRRVKELTETLAGTEGREIAGAPPGIPFSDNAARGNRNDPIRALESEVNRLRLAFLSLPKERREALVAIQQTGLAQSETVEDLAREHTFAVRQKDKADRSLEIAEERAKTANTASLRDLAAQRAVLEKTRQELAALTIHWTSSLEKRTTFSKETTGKLSSVAAVIARKETPARIREAYQQVDGIWRDLVDRIFSRIADPEQYEPVLEVPAFPRDLTDRLAGDPEAEEYKRAYEEVLLQRRSLVQLRENLFQTERDWLYRLLLQSGKLRSQLLRESIRAGEVSRFPFSMAYLKDLVREIRIVPYRGLAIFYSKLLDFRAKAASGLGGILDITWQIFLFLVLLVVPFAIFRLLRYISRFLDQARSNLVGDHARVPWAGSAALFLQRINPYFPWVGMLLGVWLAERLLRNTDLAEIGTILPYLTYYIGYRIFRILVASIVGAVAYSGSLDGISADQSRIQRTAKRLGVFFFLALAILHATETVVGKAHVYHIVFLLMLYLGAILCAFAARQWRQQIGSNVELLLPKGIAQPVKSLCLGTVSSWFFCLPMLALLLAVMTANQFFSWATRFDFFKRIGAELFRRRVEVAAGNGQDEAGSRTQEKQLPEDYLQWFNLYTPVDPSLLFEPETGVADTLRSMIRSWAKEETEEHSVAIYGDKGSGKSSLLQVLEKEHEDLRILSAVVPPKLCTREAVFTFFGGLLQVDLSNGAGALGERFSAGKKTVLLVDDAQNLFLGTLGGFEGYRAMIDLVNARTQDLFWCAVFNRRSWHYLSGVFGKNQFFRNVVEIPPWSDADIRRLIMTRHERTSLQLSYDAIIRATHSPRDSVVVAELEAQFFRLLWGQSRGNPRAALLLWISSLTAANGDGLRVGIPRHSQQKELENAGDDSLFVYSAIIRHENLSTDEIVTTTNMPEGIVRHALRVGMECNAIFRSADGRYRVTPEAQFSLNQLLERKNFLYE